MSETTERLDVAERRYDISQIVLAHGSSSISSQLHRLSVSANDVPYLIALARKQAAALERVKVIEQRLERSMQGEDREIAEDLRAALEVTP